MNNKTDIMNASTLLFDLICREHTLQDVVNLGAELLNTPVSYSDSAYTHRATSKDYPKADIEDRKAYLKNMDPLQYHEELYTKIEGVNDNTPFIMQATGTRKRWISKAYYAGKHTGHITVPEVHIPLEEIDTEVIRLISDACAISFALRDVSQLLDRCLEPENAIFEQLFYGEYKSTSEFIHKAKFHSFKDYNQFCVICANLEYSMHQIIKRRIFYLAKNINYGCWTTSFNNKVVVLIGWEKDKQSQKKIIEATEYLCNQDDFVVGISDPFTDILKVKHHYHCAEKAIVYAYTENNNKKVFLYENYKIKVFLADVNRYIGSLKEYFSSKVIDVLEYDLKNGTEYGITLKTYLSASLSPQLTADLLFIHKNTVIYRIKRLKELFDIELLDASLNFQYYFTFELLDLENGKYSGLLKNFNK